MKVAITGSRQFKNYELFKKIMEQYAIDATHIISGGAKGADHLAERYAKENGLLLTVIRPDYQSYSSKYAPLQRNSKIVQQADLVIAFYVNGKRSGGTLDAAKKAIAAGKRLIEVINGETIEHFPNLLL
ncbi:MAG: DUF2493 domain-containing protein [Bacteroidetes bacterium]|nr:DUF2493 domain-containing protein [Bacteroidota bacterium]